MCFNPSSPGGHSQHRRVSSSSASLNRWFVKLCRAFLHDISSSPTAGEPNGGSIRIVNLEGIHSQTKFHIFPQLVL
ncbi:hypothetical protein BRARA_A01980 [Brassica rapa]|uniref:Uncharacterized protein n=1 Tax=Brassica campestris TaxID=3711 RepID=A0A398ANG8_BRACM|nr:hypothetical protein BRARA_A01980 [Brassica rapa]